MSGKRRGEWHEWPFDPLEILLTLSRHRHEFVVIGALAGILQGSPLPTYSVDIAPGPGKRNRARLLAALTELDALPLTGARDTAEALEAAAQESFYTPSGHIDVHRQPAGFRSYADLRRNSNLLELDGDHTVRALSLRGIVRSKLAADDTRQLPALEATLDRVRS